MDDLTQGAKGPEAGELSLAQLEADNERRVEELINIGYSETALTLGAVAVRLQTLIDFVVGPSHAEKFEADYENALALALADGLAALNDLVAKYGA